MKVKFNNLYKQWEQIKENSLIKIEELFENSSFILGKNVEQFELEFSKYIKTKFSVGISNGTDAIKIAAQSLNLKNNILIIIPANTFVATLIGMEDAFPNADIALIDCDEYHQIDVYELEKIVEENKNKYDDIIIVPVHLYGYTCDMSSIMKIAKKFKCIILEDASQAHGAEHKGKKAGSFGNVSAFSLYPGKNLGAAGDAGIVVCNNKKQYEIIKMLRNLGSKIKYEHEIKGHNHRLDTIQAIFLNEKLKKLDQWNEERRKVAEVYQKNINNPLIELPKTPKFCTPVHHIYAIKTKNRAKLQKFLSEKNIETSIHYPILIQNMPMYRNKKFINKCKNEKEYNEKAQLYSQQMISIPIHPFLKQEEIEYVCKTINIYEEK
jgi:dTDP-4-amino-4,6-dideoxygalactose transaminase